jgi:hypothetical protein
VRLGDATRYRAGDRHRPLVYRTCYVPVLQPRTLYYPSGVYHHRTVFENGPWYADGPRYRVRRVPVVCYPVRCSHHGHRHAGRSHSRSVGSGSGVFLRIDF